MVSAAAQPLQQDILPVKPDEFKWATVSLQEVLSAGGRLEASVFDIEGRQAREILQQCKWSVKGLLPDFVQHAWYPGRFKRVYVSNTNGEAFYLPSQINELHPRPTKYISKFKGINLDTLKVNENSILITRSGTIGNCTMATKTLAGGVFSDDVIRVEPKNPKEVGYLYAFLKSKTGHTLINTNNYGAVVDHIEPEHLANIPIPDPSPIIKQRIHDLIMESFRLRDESNARMDEAQALLKDALKLPNIEEFKPSYFNASAEFQNFNVNIAQLEGRLEASYHLPIVQSILKHLAVQAKEVTTVGDSSISKKILMPGIFKRTYVEDGQGTVFIGGKNLLELDPTNKKYLRLNGLRKKEVENLLISENMVLITSRGTVGKVNIAPKHWEGWAASNNTVHILPERNDIAGYLYAWLASDWAFPLTTRQTYGAVVDMIDTNNVAQIVVPLLHDSSVQKTINDKVLEANRKRFEAYELEQKALRIMDEEVILAA